MPRIFVNGLANFAIQGGLVSFTFQDQAPKARPGAPEDVVSVVMREAEFAQMVQVFNQHLAGYQAQAGRAAPAAAAPQRAPDPAPRPAPAQGAPLKIRPKPN